MENRPVSGWAVILTVCAAVIYLSVNFTSPQVLQNIPICLPTYLMVISNAAACWIAVWSSCRPRDGFLLFRLHRPADSSLPDCIIDDYRMLFGFGYSPYSHKLNAVISNMLYLVTLLVSQEMGVPFWWALQTKVCLGEFYPGIPVYIPPSHCTERLWQFHTLQSSFQTVGEQLLPS